MNPCNKVVLIGAGGHARSILAIDPVDGLSITKYCSPDRNLSLESLYSLEYIGTDEDLLRLPDTELILGVSYTGQKVNLNLRKMLLHKFNHYVFRSLVARSALVKTQYIGAGTVVFEHAFINSGTIIGTNCVINSGAIIEHDCVIGNNVQISPGAILLGGVHVADNSFIGAGAIIRDSISIEIETVIPMGARITQNIE